ncbi:MAG: ABC transporter ATP-binding protein [Deltaproteobacteria bacterium]|nr:ABC transporter ATP-binding protein [Deltaproteobacteria bacterium]MBW2015801.1 ABC transporter ATP-binding protein [Deltaproteobacteria bacterium]MBW2129215.1 ABC transporter ATP-binding protein [Deltaproteobacteria bacterium]MBW2303363.1 ABC transporter ATP-binding protein [Deltaproteobacteria bacterium]
MESQELLRVENLKKYYPIRKGAFSAGKKTIKAVDGVSFFIREGEILGLVGESGCGKSTLGRIALRLEEPTEGAILFQGQDITSLDKEHLRRLRAEMQIIFQDPYSSLNPRYTVEQLIREPLVIHGWGNQKTQKERVLRLLEEVGLKEEHLNRYPHEFSGGQRQRIGIARALALNPKFVVCDEPVSALDVSIQAQVINLLVELKENMGLTYLFISHDLSVIEHLCDRIAVMYLGRIVEVAGADRLRSGALHPYTKALLSASPVPEPGLKRERIILEGDVPNPVDPPPGCRFHTRCPEAEERCRREPPRMHEAEPDHWVWCLKFTSP